MAEFVLYDVNRGQLESGDAVILVGAQETLLLSGGWMSNNRVGVRSWTSDTCGRGEPCSGNQNDRDRNCVRIDPPCKALVFIEHILGGRNRALRNDDEVRIRISDDPCRQGGTGYVSIDPTGMVRVSGPPGVREQFSLQIVRAQPFTLDHTLSAPFSNPNRFNAGNLVDVDWRVGRVKDYLDGRRTYDTHTGIDFGPPWPHFRTMQEGGLAVLAVANGKVIYAREDREDRCSDKAGCPTNGPYDTCKGENEVLIRHADGTVSVYAHLMKDSVPVNEGEEVRGGQLIGRVGSSGGSGGPHLHFEIRQPFDSAFWERHPGSVTFPHFWDHSWPIDPYQLQLWARFFQPVGIVPPDQQFIPLVTYVNEANRRLAREGEDILIRSMLARGYQFDLCDGGVSQTRCGENYFCNRAGFCDRRVGSGGPCTVGDQCPAGEGCRNGSCAPGPNCTNKCPVFPHPENCYVRSDGSCRRSFPGSGPCPLTCLP